MIGQWIEIIRQLLAYTLFELGGISVTVGSLTYLALSLVLLFFLSGRLRRWLVHRVLTRTQMDLGAREATGTILRYIIIVIGLMVLLPTAGVNVTTLNVIAGTVGIGLGFGLQNIANNFISGIIILLERPIRVGDRVEVGDVQGQVVKISARSTTVVTNDNIAIIVPNLSFITENVVNWSYTDARVRFRFPVSVAYGSDVRLVEKLLLDVAEAEPNILDDPAPGVRFMEFGDSGLHFELRGWSTSLLHKRGVLRSRVNFAIYEIFAAHHIEIPFPQRDVHIRSSAPPAGPPAEQPAEPPAALPAEPADP